MRRILKRHHLDKNLAALEKLRSKSCAQKAVFVALLKIFVSQGKQLWNRKVSHNSRCFITTQVLLDRLMLSKQVFKNCLLDRIAKKVLFLGNICAKNWVLPTETRKIKIYPTLCSMRMYWTNILRLVVYVKNIFERNVKKFIAP